MPPGPRKLLKVRREMLIGNNKLCSSKKSIANTLIARENMRSSERSLLLISATRPLINAKSVENTSTPTVMSHQPSKEINPRANTKVNEMATTITTITLIHRDIFPGMLVGDTGRLSLIVGRLSINGTSVPYKVKI